MNHEPLKIVHVFAAYDVPHVIIGGHAVIIHGHVRATEDLDVVFLRTPESERSLAEALSSINSYWINDTVDPDTGIEKTLPVDLPYVASQRLMMLGTDFGFVDLFDFVPGLIGESVDQLINDAITIDGCRYASLSWLRRMKTASGRPQDLIDLQNLPASPRD